MQVCRLSERTREIEKKRDVGGRGSVREGTQKEAAVRGREQESQEKKGKKGQQTHSTTAITKRKLGGIIQRYLAKSELQALSKF